MMDHMHSGFQMPMAAPPLMNPPPQIFGGYPEHGMQMHQLPPDLSVAQMFGDHGLLDDSNEAKRRRIARVSFDSWWWARRLRERKAGIADALRAPLTGL